MTLLARLKPGLLAGLLVFSLASTPVFSRPIDCDCAKAAPAPRLGIEVLLSDHTGELRGKRIGLVTNMTGVDSRLTSSIDLLAARPEFKLVALFGPEHGVRGNAQAGDPVASGRDAVTGLPVHSLYGTVREPTPEMLADIDLLIFDLQDIGSRYYTYAATLAGVMRAAKRAGIRVIVLDRPNPLGGLILEGPVLEPGFASFVGMFPIPVRHGLTIGELALLFNREFGIGADLEVIRMQGWHRDDDVFRGALPWTPPSPNMPTPDTALVYPGTALFEATNISEGRGTTRPFETIGAPFITPHTLAAQMNAAGLPAVSFRATWFTPGFSKFAGQTIGGVQIVVTDRAAFRPVRTGLALLIAIRDLHPGQFKFTPGSPPFFDRLVGNGWIRAAIEAGDKMPDIEARWQADLRGFETTRRKYLLY